MKKILSIISILLISIFCLVSCSKNKKPEIETVKITIINGNGSGEYEIGKTVSATPEIYEGETFIGWLIDGNLVSTDNPYLFVANKDLTITADISGRSPVYVDYNITYNLEGGTATNPSTYNEGMASFTLNNPVRDGYTFVGWVTKDNNTPLKTITIKKGSTGDKEYTAVWEKYVKPEKFETLKVGIFADVQLTSLNLGSTANAYISLVNHLEFCKNQSVDVLFMNGDIVNNAVEDYYILFEKALKQVYGTDESKYPEFIWNMGNHEWWDTAEHDTSSALEYFYKYARIDSPNLVKKSNVSYYLNYSYKLPSYYKVINGIPFIAISASSSSGEVTEGLRLEVEEWLEEIMELPYVKAGGSIFVAYHCALPEVTYFGQSASSHGSTVCDLFKNIPNAVIFTGDTHYPSGNERTINQKDFTSINIGSSSYSRMVCHSATSICEYYTNMENAGKSKQSQIMTGESQYLHEYTETIMIADFQEDGSTKISRYFTNDSGHESHIGLDWELPLITSKDDFIYTDERFESKEWANKMYGKDGLTWANGETVKFAVEKGKMLVTFKDVTNHNYCEHYLVEVTLDNGAVNKYDFVSSYYKWESSSHNNHFVIDNIPQSSSYKVKVTAYDYFDNPSLNTLSADACDDSTYVADDIDIVFMDTYTDISGKINYDVHTEGSHSSLEYFYQGLAPYTYGAILGRLFYNKGDSAKDYLSCTDWSQAVLVAKVKNDNDFDMYLGPTVVGINNEGKEKWYTDCGKEFQQVVKANSDWTLVAWNLSELFGINDVNKVTQLALKALAIDSVRDLENGYSFHFYIDDIDVVNESSIGPVEVKYYISAKKDATINLAETYVGSNVSAIKLDVHLDSPNGEVNFMFGNWQEFIGLICVTPTGLKTAYDGVNAEVLDNGSVRITIDPSLVTYCGNEHQAQAGYTGAIEFLYVRGSMTTSDGYISNVEIIKK